MVTAIISFDNALIEASGSIPEQCCAEVRGRIFSVDGINMFAIIKNNLDIPSESFEIYRMSTFLDLAEKGKIPEGQSFTYIQIDG